MQRCMRFRCNTDRTCSIISVRMSLRWEGPRWGRRMAKARHTQTHLWHFMTFYDISCQWETETENVIKCRKTQRARILKKINIAWTLENFKFPLEIFNLAWNFQSRLKFSILTLRIPHKNRGLVGGSLEIFNLAWKCHSFQSRLKISIPEGDLDFFKIWALWESVCRPLPAVAFWFFSPTQKQNYPKDPARLKTLLQ